MATIAIILTVLLVIPTGLYARFKYENRTLYEKHKNPKQTWTPADSVVTALLWLAVILSGIIIFKLQ